MKRNDIKALHEKTVDELNKQLAELLDKLAKARLEKTAGRLENTSSIRILADDVARVRTVIKEKAVVIQPKVEVQVEKKAVKTAPKAEAKKAAKK